MQKLSNTKSFTLIELMIVMIIIGVLFVGGVVSFQKIRQGMTFRNTVNEIEGIIKDARTYAVTSKTGEGHTNPPEYYKVEIGSDDSADPPIKFLKLYREGVEILSADIPEAVSITPKCVVTLGTADLTPYKYADIYYYPPYGKVEIKCGDAPPPPTGPHSVFELVISSFSLSATINVNDISGFPERGAIIP